MKRRPNFFKFFKKIDIVFILLLTALGLYAWHQLPQLIIRPDGFLYLISDYKIFSAQTFIGIEGFAIIWGKILPKLFGANMSLYFGFELVFILIINVFYYWLIKIIVKNSWVSFVAALLFAVSYLGLWDMHSSHCYCWFMERPINMLLLLPSFALLHLFLEKGVKKYYLISLLLYFISVGGAHFLFMFTGMFLFYPIFWLVFKEKNTIKKFKGFKIGFSYLGIAILFLLAQSSVFLPSPSEASLREFVFHPLNYQIPQKMIMELVNWSQLPALLIASYKSPYSDPISLVTYAPNVIWITPYVLAAYLIAAGIIFLKLPKYRALLITCLLATAVAFYLNLIIGHYYPLTQVGSNRYLYYPTYFLIIFWTLFLWVLYLTNRKFVIVIAAILLAYYLTNVWLINKHFKRDIMDGVPVKAVYDYIIKIMPRLDKNTLVVVAYPVGGTETQFFTEQLGKNRVRVLTDFDELNYPLSWPKIASKSAYVIKLRYDNNLKRVIEERIK